MTPHTISSKLICKIGGFLSGSGLTLYINWTHILEKSIETAIVALIGGVMGALGGLLVAWIVKKYKKMTKE